MEETQFHAPADPQQAPQLDMQPSCACAGSGTTESPVYALGRIQARFPSLDVEKEFNQALGRLDSKTLTDAGAFHRVLAHSEHRYLVRQLCWVFSVEQIDTYIVIPRNPLDFDALVNATRPSPRPTDVDAIVGIRGPLAPLSMCNGVVVPIVWFDQIYSFDIDSLVKAIPRPESIPKATFPSVAEELFQRINQMADNAGAIDEHRALNYLAVRYPGIYAAVADAYARDFALSSIYARPSRLSGARRVVDVIFAFTHRQTGLVENYFVRVDVTGRFPFLVSKISPYYVYDQNP